MPSRWFQYEPATFASGVNVSPEDLDALNRAGIPRSFLGDDIVLKEPVGVEVPGRGHMIRFTKGLNRGVYYDPSTGEVMRVNDPDWPGPKPMFVNSSLQQYVRTMRALTEAFPFYTSAPEGASDQEEDVEIAERLVAEKRLGDMIRAIDPAAMAPDSFWADFVYYVALGNWSTEEVLGKGDPPERGAPG